MKTIAQLNARSVQLAGVSNRLAGNIHDHMVDIVEHFKQHGDCTAMTTLHNVLHSAIRKNAIKAWAEGYAGMKFNPAKTDKGTGKVTEAHFTRNKEIPFDQIDLEAARSVSPWDYAPEPAFKPFDLDAAIKAAIKKAETALADSEHADLHKVNADKLAALKALA